MRSSFFSNMPSTVKEYDMKCRQLTDEKAVVIRRHFTNNAPRFLRIFRTHGPLIRRLVSTSSARAFIVAQTTCTRVAGDDGPMSGAKSTIFAAKDSSVQQRGTMTTLVDWYHTVLLTETSRNSYSTSFFIDHHHRSSLIAHTCAWDKRSLASSTTSLARCLVWR